MVDIENALGNLLRQEVTRFKVIEVEALEALKRFVTILIKYLPMRFQVLNFMANLKNYLDASKNLTGETFERDLLSLESENAILPGQQLWKACQGSSPKYRGYPCSLWTTFHTLTINAVARSQGDHKYHPLEVMRAIHDYVKHFFSCDYCSKHFQQMYAIDAETFVQKRGDEVVWMWRGHNKVNARLRNDASEDPKHPKRQFPYPENCPECYVTENEFDVERSIEYLTNMYIEDAISLNDTQKLTYTSSNEKALTFQSSGTEKVFNFLINFFVTGIAPLLNFYVYKT